MEFLLVPHMAMEYWENILVRLMSFFHGIIKFLFNAFLRVGSKKQTNKQKKRKTRLSSSAIILPFTLSSFSALLVLHNFSYGDGQK